MIDGVPVVREAFPHTVRLVTTARLRDSVLAELVDGDDLAALAEIEGATSRRLTAETRGIAGLPANELVHGVAHARFINASFAYAKPRALSRFNGPDRGAWYAALEVETSVAEVAYHLTQALADAGDFNAVVDYAEMHASLAGEFLDLRQRPDHQALDPDETRGYAAGNAMANAARAAGLNGVIYPSVRCPSGTCVAALWPHAVQSVAQGKVWRLTWNGKPEPQISRVDQV
ncbi:RES family NAD+ phosphorylase [Sphingomonas bacterium]|uniref:RES family NAD+ phosphorylase n=1 Tax=Sphingomonas bacterium TaxID=1895847 RepID=UPI001C2DA617|nr:RES family NAD+ phosphorylase [Sphingomonas bacterium]